MKVVLYPFVPILQPFWSTLEEQWVNKIESNKSIFILEALIFIFQTFKNYFVVEWNITSPLFSDLNKWEDVFFLEIENVIPNIALRRKKTVYMPASMKYKIKETFLLSPTSSPTTSKLSAVHLQSYLFHCCFHRALIDIAVATDYPPRALA